MATVTVAHLGALGEVSKARQQLAPATGDGHTHRMRAYEVRRAEKRRSQPDPGDLGWIIVCAVDAGPFVPLKPVWEYDTEAVAQLEADRLSAVASGRPTPTDPVAPAA